MHVEVFWTVTYMYAISRLSRPHGAHVLSLSGEVNRASIFSISTCIVNEPATGLL